jgi:hypothetical protein
LEVPLPWERLLWSAQTVFPLPRRVRYFLTDFRLVCIEGDRLAELALDDIDEVQRSQTRLDRLTGTSTITVRARRATRPLVLHGIRRGHQLAALLELLSGEPRPALDADAVRAALAWNPRVAESGVREAAAAVALVVVAVFGVVIGLHGKAAPESYSPDDPIAPNGEKRSRAEIVRFMQTEVMPWARAALGPIKGGPDRITCATCHGANPEARGWQMPAVATLPQPEVRNRGWERYSGAMDAQMRNAIYGYIAESDNQTRATYMREVVMPGMARLLERPAYDFTKTYEYNRSRHAFGCYHCHKVK